MRARAGDNVKKNVLVVDDDSLIRQLVALMLRASGFTVIEAVNGQDALAKLDDSPVGIVITDLRMPQMDGLEFTRELRRKPDYKDVPVVMLTSEFSDYKRTEGISVGVDEWISKPFIPQQLLHAVRRFAA